jgi:hypothetical protein
MRLPVFTKRQELLEQAREMQERLYSRRVA